jgi:hypothetical protein
MNIKRRFIWWAIQNPRSILNWIFLKISKSIYGRYNQKYYPSKIRKLVKNYIKTEDIKFISSQTTLNKKKIIGDSEIFEKFHRFEIFKDIKNKDEKLGKINRWYKKNIPQVNNIKSDKNDLIWEGYNISYRIVNTINFCEKYKIKKIDKFIKFDSFILLQRLEYFNLGINNHILKNAQALLFSGIYLNDLKLKNIGLEIFRSTIHKLIDKNGLLRESSSSYQLLVSNLLLETSEFLIKHKRYKENYLIIHKTKKMVEASNFFNFNRKLVIFGDLTPDKATNELEKKVFDIKRYFPKTSKILKINKFKKKKKFGEYQILRHKNFSLYLKFKDSGNSKYLNHQHEDNFHFNFFYKKNLILTSLNRLNYKTIDGALSSSHNSVTINDYGPLMNLNKKLPYNYLKNDNEIIDKYDQQKCVYLKSDCFKFLNRDNLWERKIKMLNDNLVITDKLITKNKVKKEIFFHFHPNIIFLKQNKNHFILKEKKMKKLIKLEYYSNTKIKIKKYCSYYVDTYGNKSKTNSLIFINDTEKNFTNNINLKIIK